MKTLYKTIKEGILDIEDNIEQASAQVISTTSRRELDQIIQQRLREDRSADLNDLDVSKIKDMSNLFCEFGNTPLHYSPKIDKWDVSNVTNMEGMFYGCQWFQCDLSKWDVSNVTNMRYMFQGCNEFTGKGLENWNVQKVTTTEDMFANCDNFNIDLGNWQLNNCLNMAGMFQNCENFTGKGLEKWNVCGVKNMDSMFRHCDNFNGKIGKWNVKNVEKIDNICYGCDKFNQDLSKWRLISAGDACNMFYMTPIDGQSTKHPWFK